MDVQNKSFLERYITEPLAKLSQTKFVRAIMNTGVSTIPFTIVGSMFLVLNVLPLAIPPLQGFFEATFFKFSDLYMLANTATMGMLAIYFCVVLGYEFTKVYIDDEGLNLSPINGALLSLFAFFMTIPQLIWSDGHMIRVTDINETSPVFAGWAMGADGVSRFGTIGLFSAIIMAVLAVMLYRLCVKRNWIITMPDAVPAGVARSFTALIPAFVIAFVVLVINGVLVFLGTDLFQIIQIPFGFVTNMTNSYAGLLVIYFLIHALWSVGIHGATIITSLISPIVLANLTSNINGANIPLAGEFNNAFVTIGGSGATLGLIFWFATRAKSEQLSVLGKTSLIPGLFNINEPIIFGVPIIYNPDLLIPFILAPMASASVAYWAIKLQFVNPVVVQMPWPTPVGIGGFISTGGDWRGFLLAIVCVVVAFLVYYPFVKKYDAKLVKQEEEKAAALAANVGDELDDEDFFAL